MKHFIFISLCLLLISCKVEPQPINYGSDACHFCNMTIVDRQHASQLVTSKGKAYKYDAIECMIHSLQDEFKQTEMAHYLVTDLNKDAELIDAAKAYYLISENLQSPMGANLSAFKNESEANEAQQKFTGKTYNWEQIQQHIKLQD